MCAHEHKAQLQPLTLVAQTFSITTLSIAAIVITDTDTTAAVVTTTDTKTGTTYRFNCMRIKGQQWYETSQQ